jgi:predicted Zn-dependent protease
MIRGKGVVSVKVVSGKLNGNTSALGSLPHLLIFLFFTLPLYHFATLPLSIAADISVPMSKEMAQAVKPISAEEEVEIGREVAANVIAQFGLYDNEPLTDYLNMVGLTVAQAAPRKDVRWRFAVLDSDIVNAFAAPGGYIFVSKGLLFLLKDEAQLASVLAHEIAHVSQRHVVKEIQKSKLASAVIPGYVKATAQKAEWMSQISDLAVQMIWKGLSRDDEIEADRLGVEFASAIGYDAMSFKEVLEKLLSRSQAQDHAKELKFLLSTHPKPEDRLAALDQKLKGMAAGGARLDDRFKKSVKTD